MTFSVDSEVGQLRQAIIHRPGLELSRLTPDNIDELLFDDVMWASKAKEEHDAFAEALRDKGVLVHYYGELLAETLEIAEVGPSCSTDFARPSSRPVARRAGTPSLRRPRRRDARRVPSRWHLEG